MDSMNKNKEKKAVSKNLSWIFTALSISFAAVFPVVFLFLQNVLQVTNQEFWPLFFAFLAFGWTIFLFILVFCRSVDKAGILAFLAIVAFANFFYFESLARFIYTYTKYWHVLLLLLFVFAHLAYFICVKTSQTAAKDLNKIFALVITGLVLFNIFTAVPDIIKKASTKMPEIEKLEDVSAESLQKQEMPNVYHLVFDEYANFPALEQYFDYNNAPLRENLEKNKFNISMDSINNAQTTILILPDYFNYGEVPYDDISEEFARQLLREPKIKLLFEQAGYTVKLVTETEFVFSALTPETGKVSAAATDMSGKTFMELILQKTIAYPLFQGNTKRNAQDILNCFKYFQTLDYSRQEKTYTVMYLNSPHAPFLFGRDGRGVSRDNQNNWSVPDYYLNQLIFITEKITQTIDTIVENDPNSIIILQSDHGCRLLKDEEGNSAIDSVNRRNILNAVYYQGQEMQEIEGRSGVNTIRLVLNRLLGLGLPLLEEVHE